MPAGDRNVEGETTAITTFSTVRWWGRYWLPVLFWAVGRFPFLTKRLRSLDFIYFAHWTLVTQPPYNGAPQHAGRLRYARLFFASNFTGSWDEYIKAFANKLRTGMSAFWRSSFGFPGPLPVQPFMDYIRENEFDSPYYWSAYPDATVTRILRALRLAGHDGTVPVSRPFMAMCPTRAGLDGELYDALAALTDGPLAASTRTHMGRMVLAHDFHQDAAQPQADHLDGPYLVLTANLDGDLDTWLDEVCSHPAMHDILRRCIGCPDTPAGLKGYLRHNEIAVGLSYAAYPTATVADVKAALKMLPAEDAPEWASETPVERIHVARAARLAGENYDRRHPPGSPRPFRRDQHAEEYGTLTGSLVVDAETVPADMRHGLLAESDVHEITARFSPNGPMPWPLHPPVGIGLKVDGVKNLTAQGPEEVTQDFLAVSNIDRFFCGTAEDAVDLVRAQGGGLRGLIAYFATGLNPRRWRMRELRIMVATMMGRVADPLAGVTYYSVVPIMCGPDLAVKAAVRMAGTSPRRWSLRRPDHAAGMRRRLATGDARFTLLFQPQQLGESIDDIRVSWGGPWIPVAEGVLPVQPVGDGEALTFTLAHCHPDHESPGPIPAVRRSVYETISRRRHAAPAP